MAERRMFAKTIIDSDVFIELPMSARLLYYDLGMRADDDGFINNPKKIMKITGATNDDMNILINRKFIIPFDTGIVVIKHWRIHNYIQKDRYKETNYKQEKEQLLLDENNAYKRLDTECIQDVSKMYTQVRLGKVSIGKSSIEDILSSNSTTSEQKIEEKKEVDEIPYERIVDYLNFTCNTNFKPTTKKTKDLIRARFKEGFNESDFQIVIQKKARQWLKDKKMNIYLRPETLFSNHFESYLNEPEKEITTKDLPLDLSGW